MSAADHIVIGSGINGLVAAAMLAKKGGRVTVLERSDRIGGCMMTAEITEPGFLHDVMATTFVLFLTGPANAALGPDLARHGLAFCHTPHPTAVLRPNGASIVLTTDRTANVAAFNAASPGDGDRHRTDMAAIEAKAPLLFGLLGADLWSRGTLGLVAKSAWRDGPRGLGAWLGDALIPARGWLETAYRDPTLQALHAPWTLHCGLTPEAAYSGQMAKVVAFALEAAGAPVVAGGARRAADALRALIEEKGGTVLTGAEADRILVVGGRATGVVTADGVTHSARTAVLASVDPVQLYGRLLRDERLPQQQAAAQRFRHGRGNFQLHYALARPPAWKTSGLEKVALIHLSDGIDAVSKSSNEAERGLLPATPTICVGQPSALDPSRCPPGKAVLWLQIPDAQRILKGDASDTILTEGAWTDAVREAFADRIEAILASHIDGFHETILARRAVSPADLEALNPNLVGGDPYGGACSLDQFFLWRPFPGSVNHATAIKGLYHIGASTHPGPGLGGGSGYLAARALGA